MAYLNCGGNCGGCKTVNDCNMAAAPDVRAQQAKATITNLTSQQKNVMAKQQQVSSQIKATKTKIAQAQQKMAQISATQKGVIAKIPVLVK